MTKNTQIRYNDLYLRIFLCLIAAHLVVMNNEPVTFFDVALKFSYWRGMAGSFAIAMLLTGYIYTVTRRLDQRFTWHHDTLLRLFWQTVLGFGLPALAAFMLAAGFFALYGVNILKTVYLRQDYVLILIMLLVFNTYYFGLYSFLRLRDLATKHPQLVDSLVLEQQVSNVLEKEINPVKSAMAYNEAQAGKEILIVHTATQSMPVATGSIAYCFILNGAVFLRTFEMVSINESYPLDENMKTLEELLDRQLFFRINRQMLINLNACKSFKSGKNKTIQLVLEPEPYDTGVAIPEGHERILIVSEDRVPAFRAWINR